MADFLRECNEGYLKTDAKTFQDTWCSRCSRKDCDLAGFALTDPMARRQATWQDRFFGNHFADPNLPKYAQIVQQDFPDLLRKAMRLEVSSRRGDWSVPEIPVLDGIIQPATKDLTDHVDSAVQRLTGKTRPPVDEDDVLEAAPIDDILPDEDEDEEDEVPPPVKEHPRRPPPTFLPQMDQRNTPDQGEVMIGGAPAPAVVQRSRPAPENDPWAPAPKPKVTVVKSGARLQFDAVGHAKVVKNAPKP